MTLEGLIAALDALPADMPVVFATAEGEIGGGYHVTELKLAQIESVDCGGCRTGWSEAVMQLLDGGAVSPMPVRKLGAILGRCRDALPGLAGRPLRVEFAHGNAGLGVYDLDTPFQRDGVALVRLQPVRALCKPAVAGCCVA